MAASPLDGVRGILTDLDGVVYRGPQGIDSALEALRAARRGGTQVICVTNNAGTPAPETGRRLRQLGLPVEDQHVITSAMAGARVLKESLGDRDGSVLAVGGPGVAWALRELDLEPVERFDPECPPVGVLQGYGPDTPWSAFAEASYAIQHGATWCLTNGDRTIPTAQGQAPGNGMAGEAVRAATGAEPLTAGKPHPPIYELAAAVAGAEPAELLAIGDRLDTDVAGAVALGMRSVLVLTGVHDLADLATAPDEQRATYLLPDLSTLTEPYQHPELLHDKATCGGATARREGDGLLLKGGSPVEQARAAVALIQHLLDAEQLGRDAAVRLVPSWAELSNRGEG